MGTIFDRDFDGFVDKAIEMAAEAGNRKRQMKIAEINAHLFGEREKLASQERIAAANRESNEKIAYENRTHNDKHRDRSSNGVNELDSAFGAADARRSDHLAFEQKKQNDINRNSAMNTLVNLLTRGDSSGKNDAIAARDARFDQKEERSDRKGFLKDVENEYKNLRIQNEKDNKDILPGDKKYKAFDETVARKTALDNVTNRYKEFGLAVPSLPSGGVDDNDIASTISRGSGSAPGMTQQNTQQNPNDVMRQALIQGLAKQLGIQMPQESVHDTFLREAAPIARTIKATNGMTFFEGDMTGDAYARKTKGMTTAQQIAYDRSVMPDLPTSPYYSGLAARENYEAGRPGGGLNGGPTPGGNFSFIEINGKRMSAQEAINMPFNSGAPAVSPPPPPAVAGLKPQLPSSSASVTPATPVFGDIFNKPTFAMPATPGHLRQPAPSFEFAISRPGQPTPKAVTLPDSPFMPNIDGSGHELLPLGSTPSNNPFGEVIPAAVRPVVDAFSGPYAQNVKKDLSIIGGNVRQATNDALGVFAESRMIRNNRSF